MRSDLEGSGLLAPILVHAQFVGEQLLGQRPGLLGPGQVDPVRPEEGLESLSRISVRRLQKTLPPSLEVLDFTN